ncbi:hypothetical protein [Sphingobium sp. D43FB]|nr:hypothetical protein [Sphingobium sp. D43FB]
MSDNVLNKDKCPVTHLTTAFGAPVAENRNSLIAAMEAGHEECAPAGS